MSEELKRCPQCGEKPTEFSAPIGWVALRCKCYGTQWCRRERGNVAQEWNKLCQPPDPSAEWSDLVKANLVWENWGSDPKQESGSHKPPLHLIPPAANEEMAKALACGAAKYGIRNWLLGDGVNYTVYLAALKRHIDCIIDGEDIDPESGAHHLGHVLAGAAIVLDAQRHGKLIDDRVLPPNKKEL